MRITEENGPKVVMQIQTLMQKAGLSMEDIYMKVSVELYNVEDEDGFEIALNWYQHGRNLLQMDETPAPPNEVKRVRIRGKYPETNLKEKCEELAAWIKLVKLMPKEAPVVLEDTEDGTS